MKLWAARDERGTFLFWNDIPPPLINGLFCFCPEDQAFSVGDGSLPGINLAAGSFAQITTLATGDPVKSINHRLSATYSKSVMSYGWAVDKQRQTGKLLEPGGTVINDTMLSLLREWLFRHPESPLPEVPDDQFWRDLEALAEECDQ